MEDRLAGLKNGATTTRSACSNAPPRTFLDPTIARPGCIGRVVRTRRLGESALAEARYSLAVTDYRNTYYGRPGAGAPGAARPSAASSSRIEAPRRRRISDDGSGESAAVARCRRTRTIMRALLGLDQALDELRYAQKAWGDSSADPGDDRVDLSAAGTGGIRQPAVQPLRAAINAMKRAYPQFMAAGGEGLPPDVLTVIFPLAYWDLIQKYAAEHGLDPYLVAALVAQESTFVPDIRSSANAVGLMQLDAADGAAVRAAARSCRIRRRLLTNPEANIRMGTAYLADKIREFGDLHLALASYNAGERPVRRWIGGAARASRDEFIDDIPYPETQNYVKKILGTAEDYRRLYGSPAAASRPTWIPTRAPAGPPV